MNKHLASIPDILEDLYGLLWPPVAAGLFTILVAAQNDEVFSFRHVFMDKTGYLLVFLLTWALLAVILRESKKSERLISRAKELHIEKVFHDITKKD